MLNVMIAAPEDVRGDYYLKCGVTGEIKRGEFVLLSGAWTHAGGPTGLAGRDGYAKSGDKAAHAFSANSVLATGTWGQSKWISVGIADKNLTQVDYGDLTLDKMVSGDGIKVYVGGVFETDQYNADDSWTDMIAGEQMLYISDAGVLTTGIAQTQVTTGVDGLAGSVAFARFLGVKSGYDANYAERAMVRFELLKTPYHPGPQHAEATD